MRNILTLFLIMNVITIYSQDNTTPSYTIELNSKFDFKSNSLGMNFFSDFLYGGHITNKEKDKWLSNISENNIINFEVINSIKLTHNKNKNSFILEISDKNIANLSFTDDILGLILKGNYYYEDDTLKFDNTSLKANRFQQIKFGYSRDIKSISIGTAISFLHGNHHYSYMLQKGHLYTGASGSLLDLNYDMQAFATDTSNLSFFLNNGYGFAFDINVKFKHDNWLVNIYLTDLGFIKWKKSSIIYSTDSNFVFNGIEVEDFINFNDSIIENEVETFKNNLTKTENRQFKSYIPANFGISFYSKITNHIVKDITTGFNFRWQPYMDNLILSGEKITQGIKESNYFPYFYFTTTCDAKYIDIISQIAYGGFTENINLGLAMKIFKKNPIIIGTNHLETVFNYENNESVNIYLQMQRNF
ncbi:MAG: DUF5723 family protein [Bacteroidota bacterium]|nr:DUF5723 family protein [Bacteroidota bacterium]